MDCAMPEHERHRSGTKNPGKFPQAGILMAEYAFEETLVSQALEAGARVRA